MKNFLILSSAILLGGCAGSGGSSSSSSSGNSADPFTNWSSVVVGSPVSFSSGASTTLLVDGSVTQSYSDAAATLVLGANSTFTSINASNGSGSAAFNSANGDTLQAGFSGTTTVALNKAQTVVGAFANPASYGFEYQTFGAWGAYGNSTAPAYAVSVGNPSPATAIPATGALTFTGGTNGYYTDLNKFTYVTNANMVANVTFDSRTVAFSTTNTSVIGGPNGQQLSVPSLNMTGTLSYASGANAISGSVSTANGMSGSANGKFYGPSLNEIGGTYAVTGSGIGSMVGGFGGRR